MIYFLWDRICHHPPKDWPFSKRQPQWLYDEIDVVPDSRQKFLHRVLLSDGSVIEGPFVWAVIHSLPLQASDESKEARQSA